MLAADGGSGRVGGCRGLRMTDPPCHGTRLGGCGPPDAGLCLARFACRRRELARRWIGIPARHDSATQGPRRDQAGTTYGPRRGGTRRGGTVSGGGSKVLVYRVEQSQVQAWQATDRVLTDLGTAAGVSDRGLRRTRNEDAMALRLIATGDMVVAVADGVSASHRPHEASRAAVDVAVEVLAAAVLDRADLIAATREAAAGAAMAVAALRRPDEGGTAPACTFVSAVVSSGRITVGWIGDSRAYWLAGRGDPPSQCLTTDDTWAGQAGRGGRQTSRQAYGDGHTGPLWRWLGDAADRKPARVTTLETTGSGSVLLCSDGLWSYLWNSDELAAVVDQAASPLSAASMLTQVALDSGGRDNVTAVVVAVDGGTTQAGGNFRKESTIPFTWGSTV